MFTVSANGALEYASTGSALVDFNARATEFRSADEEAIIAAAMEAYAENPVQFVKLVFQTGDIRGGKGERHAFNSCIDYLVKEHPLVAWEILTLIPEYTRWDYLVRLTVSENALISEQATKLVVEQFRRDLDNADAVAEGEMPNISLLAKWMPSLQTKKPEQKIWVRHLLKSLHMQEREYRHALSKLRGHLNIIEKSMSIKDYDSIDMEKMTSKQQLRYANFLTRVMAERRHEYIQAVLRGEKKMNTSVLNPVEIWHEYVKSSRNRYNEDYEAIWSMLPDRTTGNGNTMVIRDGSGSMTMPMGRESSASMLDAASAMTVYCAERLTGAFKDKFITFSSCPKMVDMSECETLIDKMRFLNRYADMTNTNIEATFDLILDVAVENHLSQDEIPSYLLILSDMEFDVARGANWWMRNIDIEPRETLFATIKKKWANAGYEVPTLVFWQLNGERTIYPEIDSKNGIIFLSGFSTNELELVMAGEYERLEEVTKVVEVVDEETGETTFKQVTDYERVVLSPEEQLELKLSDPRYDAVEEAVKRGLLKESA